MDVIRRSLIEKYKYLYDMMAREGKSELFTEMLSYLKFYNVLRYEECRILYDYVLKCGGFK